MTLPRVEPLRPVRSADVPIGREWLYELKLDGFRGLLHIEDGRAHFVSKNCHHLRRFDALAVSLAQALRAREAILDGEIVVMNERGPDFKALFYRRRPAGYAAFDLLWLDGRDLRPQPLWRRKRALSKLIAGTPIASIDSTSDPTLFARAMLHDLEGIVAKRRHDPYCAATEWRKIKWRGYSQLEGRWEMFAD